MEIRVGGKYKIAKKLGHGAFGDLYSGINIKTNEEVAIKLEKLETEQPMLQYEAKIYEKLAGSQGIPQVHWQGVEGDFNVMVMDILGPPLQDLFDFCDRKWGMQTILSIAMQLIQRIEVLHSKNFIHRDIKPENFLVGAGKKSNLVYMIDFGLSKRFKCPKTGQHVKHVKRNGILGTPRYCSLNAHSSFEQSRRDDLESIGNVLIYFAKGGELPWMKYEAKSNRYQNEFRQKLTLEEICSGLPECFLEYMNYCRNVLEFTAKPDYQYIRSIFETEYVFQGFKPEFKFDWQTHKEKLITEKIKQEEEKAEQDRIENEAKDKKKGSKKNGLSKLEQQRLDQKKAFEEQEAEKQKKQEIKKKQKKEKFLSEIAQPEVKSQKEILADEKTVRDAKIKEKIKKICITIENSALPKAMILADDSDDELNDTEEKKEEE